MAILDVVEIDKTSITGSEPDGAYFAIGSGATGALTGLDGQIAAQSSVLGLIVAGLGIDARYLTDNDTYTWDGANWTKKLFPPDPLEVADFADYQVDPTLVQAGGATGTDVVASGNVAIVPLTSLSVDVGEGGTTDVALAANVLTVNRAGTYKVTFKVTSYSGGFGFQLAGLYARLNSGGSSTGLAQAIDGSLAYLNAPGVPLTSVTFLVALVATDTLALFYDNNVGSSQNHSIFNPSIGLTLERVGE